MPQENVEIVKANIDAINREDWDAAFQEAAPDFELDMSRGLGLINGIYGLDEARRAWEEFAGLWESFRVEPHEFIEVGDHVVVPGTAHMVGRDGIEVESRVTFVYTIRNGALERITMYQERQDALEDLGLSEQDVHADS